MRNIPNILTIFRITLIPVFLFLVLEDRFLTGAAVFITAGVTDAIDGFIAKKYNSRTALGAFLDPMADKLLLITAFLALNIKGFLPLWLTGLVVLRDAVIFTGFVSLKSAGRAVEIAPTVFGKLTTFLQIATIIFVLVFADSGEDLFTVLSVAVAASTVYSGFDYVRREFLIQTGKKAV